MGGAHAKGVDDAESDIDLYVFGRQALSGEERTRLCEQPGCSVESVVSWGDTREFSQAGTDFRFRGRKIECWLRSIEYVSNIVAECKAGVVRHDFVTWTVMGFYNYCTLSDLNEMIPVDDPYGILARWKSEVSEYPWRLREAIIGGHMRAAKFWPDNFHYKSAIERRDVIYVTGIVQQVIANLIQVVFALNQAYFPGEKKLDVALSHLELEARFFHRTHQAPGLSRRRARRCVSAQAA